MAVTLARNPPELPAGSLRFAASPAAGRLHELEDLLVGVAQDMREPLNALRFQTAILNHLDEPTKADVEVAVESATHAVERLERLLSLLQAAAQLSRKDAVSETA